MKKIKILHVVESFGGGVFSAISQLVNALDPERFENTIIYSPRPETPDDFESSFVNGTRFIHVRMHRDVRPPQDFWSLVRLLRLLRKESPDIIHLHSSKAGALGRIASRISGYRNVYYSPHGFSFLRADVARWKQALFEQFEKIAARFGGTVVACSQGEYQEAHRLGIDAALIPNAIDLALIDSIAPRRIAPEGKFVVGTAGRITWARNPRLFRSIATSFRNDKRFAFVWIGDGEIRDSLEGGGADITVTGWKSRGETLALIAGLDVYIQPSLWEGMPISVLEAMALRKPTVVTPVVGNRDLIRTGENGFIAENAVEFVQALKLLRKDDKLRRSFGENARTMIEENHTIPVMVKRFEALYAGGEDISVRPLP